MNRGYTLIELLLALALLALVVGGALQLQVTFNRQSQRQQAAAELLANLHLAMPALERAVRSAGEGLPPGTRALFALCEGEREPAFSFADENPDSFRVLASDGAVTLDSIKDGVTFVDARAPQTWKPGDRFVVLDPCAGCAGAVRQVKEAFSATTPPPARLAHDRGCAAVPVDDDRCLGRTGCARPGAQLHRFSGSVRYRVTNHKLMMASRAIADHIDDMQIAVIESDGTVCEKPTACDFSRAAAVRITLVARSPRVAGVRREMTRTVQLRNFN